MSYRRELWELAAQSHGVVTVAQAEEVGVPAVELRKLAQRGALRAQGHGVYVHASVPLTELTQLAIAVALVGPGAYLHRETVLDLHGLGHFNPPRIQVATARRVRRRLPEWLRLEARADVVEGDQETLDGLPVTTVSRALNDIWGHVPPDRWKAVVTQAFRQGLITEREQAQLEEVAVA